MDSTGMKGLLFFLMTSFVGWIFLLVSIRSRREHRKRLERERTRATGSIVDYAPGRGDAGRPVVEFIADGRQIRLENKSAVDRARYPVGASVEVLYDPDDPSRFHLESDADDGSGSAALARVGYIWLACAAALTLALMTLVGGYRIDLQGLWRSLRAPRGAEKTAVEKTRGDSAFEYRAQANGTAVISKYTGTDSALTLPLLVDFHPVTGMSSMAFARCSQLKSLTVPGVYASVPPGAFTGCLSLSEVTLQEGVESIGTQAFGLCLALKDVTLPASLSRIDDNAFPEDCAARFHVVEGSEAARYCAGKGFDVQFDG